MFFPVLGFPGTRWKQFPRKNPPNWECIGKKRLLRVIELDYDLHVKPSSWRWGKVVFIKNGFANGDTMLSRLGLVHFSPLHLQIYVFKFNLFVRAAVPGVNLDLLGLPTRWLITGLFEVSSIPEFCQCTSLFAKKKNNKNGDVQQSESSILQIIHGPLRFNLLCWRR